MGIFRAAAFAVVLSGAIALSGCGHGTYYAGVTVGPPAPQAYGAVGVAPGPGYVWTDGYYVWGGSSWVWRPGRWARPPHPGYTWRKPYYDRYRNGYRYHEGHWARK
ncbi:MAG TPA: YXWGXW repeat-containing protein [Bryobacteraceae bacterium]|nr:YXWGXW repeat-containing protein [Bryobacteraceae bacterium]